MHKCAAHNCDAKIEDKKLFCREHWDMLPRFIQEGVFEGVMEMSEKKIRYFKKQGISFLRETRKS